MTTTTTTTTTHDLVELCRKLRYDLTAAQGKLSEVMQALDGGDVRIVERLPADVAIERQIRNGAVTDIVTLDAELRAARITGPEASTLRSLLHRVLVTDERTDPE